MAYDNVQEEFMLYGSFSEEPSEDSSSTFVLTPSLDELAMKYNSADEVLEEMEIISC
jgi:hypothetical protein